MGTLRRHGQKPPRLGHLVAEEEADPALVAAIIDRSIDQMVTPYRDLEPLTAEKLEEMGESIEKPGPSNAFLDEWLANGGMPPARTRPATCSRCRPEEATRTAAYGPEGPARSPGLMSVRCSPTRPPIRQAVRLPRRRIAAATRYATRASPAYAIVPNRFVPLASNATQT